VNGGRSNHRLTLQILPWAYVSKRSYNHSNYGLLALVVVIATLRESPRVQLARARLPRRLSHNAEQEESALSGKGLMMTIEVSEDIQVQLDQVKEWMESKVGREVTYDEILSQVLKNFQSVLYPEDLGSA
jgi:hypothetical protein